MMTELHEHTYSFRTYVSEKLKGVLIHVSENEGI